MYIKELVDNSVGGVPLQLLNILILSNRAVKQSIYTLKSSKIS